MININRILTVLALVIFSSLSLKALAIDYKTTGHKLKLVANFWEPYTGDELEGKGIACSVVISTLKEVGIDAEIQVLPWARAYKMVQEGKADGIVAIWQTKDRSNHVHFSNSYLKNDIVLLKRKDTHIEYTGLSSLEGLTVGLGRGYDYHSSLVNYKDINKVYFTRVQHAIEMLYRGRIDVLLTDKKIAQFHIQKIKNIGLKQELDFVPTKVFELPLYFGMSKKHQYAEEIIEKFNNAMSNQE